MQRRPDWLVHHIESRVEAGTLPGLDLSRFGAVVRDVERWRAEHDLIDRTDARTSHSGPFPPMPDFELNAPNSNDDSRHLHNRR